MKNLIFGILVMVGMSCSKVSSREKETKRTLVQETESFFLTQLPKKMKYYERELFILDKYNSVIGIINSETGVVEGTVAFSNVPVDSIYRSFEVQDSLIFSFEEIVDLDRFKKGWKIDNFIIKNDSLIISGSLSIPSLVMEMDNARAWHNYSFVVVFDANNYERLSWFSVFESPDERTTIGISTFSDFYLDSEFLWYPTNTVGRGQSPCLLLFKKISKHSMEHFNTIEIADERQIELGPVLYSELSVLSKGFLWKYASGSSFYNRTTNEMRKNYEKDNTLVIRSFPNESGKYEVVRNVTDTIMVVDWRESGIPVIDVENQFIYRITNEKDHYYITRSYYD